MRVNIELPDDAYQQILDSARAEEKTIEAWLREALATTLTPLDKQEGFEAVNSLIGQGHVKENWKEELRSLRKGG